MIKDAPDWSSINPVPSSIIQDQPGSIHDTPGWSRMFQYYLKSIQDTLWLSMIIHDHPVWIQCMPGWSSIIQVDPGSIHETPGWSRMLQDNPGSIQNTPGCIDLALRIIHLARTYLSPPVNLNDKSSPDMPLGIEACIYKYKIACKRIKILTRGILRLLSLLIAK